MIRINNETIEVITRSEVFKKNVSILASITHMTRQDAEQELLVELFLSRLDDNITEMDTATSKSIVFARKDLERDYYTDLSKQQKYEVAYDSELLENVAELVSANSYLKDYEIDSDKFNLIVSLFHSTQQGFVARLLLTGQEATQDFTHDSAKVFNQKMSRVEQYARAHQGKFRTKLLTPYDLELKAMSDAIDEFFDLYQSDPNLISNKVVKDYFTSHQDMYPFSEALDVVHYQGKLFDDWRGYKERSSFLIELNHQQQVLLDKIAERKSQRGY